MNNSKGNTPRESAPAQRKRRIFIIALIVLVLLNGILVFQWINTSRDLAQTEEELVSTSELKDEIEQELFQIEAELEQYKDEVHELDTALQNRNQELQEKTDELQELLNRHDVTLAELSEAREELGVLRYYTRKYREQRDSLMEANERLVEEKEELQEGLEEEKRARHRIKDENVSLSNRVSLAERLEVSDLEATGVRYTAIGNRERTTSRSDRVERLRVCFTLDENIVAEAEAKTLYIRMLNPERSTIQVGEAGSGTFMYRGDETPYTMDYRFQYEQEEYSDCVYWGNSPNYPAGEYEVQLFSDGHQIGKEVFRIR